jgi:hypothetical protein
MSSTPEPDEDINRTFAAVGHAFTQWEYLEWQLSHLYSIFVGKPRQIGTIEEYGRENSTFNNRMTRLEKMAERYFQPAPCQEKEGEFSSIIAECRAVSIKRHHIAHGVVTGVQVFSNVNAGEWAIPSIGYFVVPPRYAAHNLTKHTRVYYTYGSAQIDKIAKEFRAALVRVATFNELLSPQR